MAVEAAVLQQSKMDCSSSTTSRCPNALSPERCATVYDCPQDCHPIAWLGSHLHCSSSSPDGWRSDPGMVFVERPWKRGTFSECSFYHLLLSGASLRPCHQMFLFRQVPSEWSTATPELWQMMHLISIHVIALSLQKKYNLRFTRWF